MTILLTFIYLMATLTILYRGMPQIAWEMASAIYLLVALIYSDMGWVLYGSMLCVIGLIFLTIRQPWLKRRISQYFYRHAANSLPKLSKTEEEALNAGDTWLEEELFTGSLNWDRLKDVTSELTKEEQAFLANETQQLCDQLHEWDISQRRDLPEAVWTFIREKGFMGLVIDKKYGGKGFSARAHSEVVMKISTRSSVAAVTVMVPNSLGPGELLQYYGTPAQKSYYLPRLAQGIDIPCFALTEPGAGSDATSLDSEAIVTRRKIDGKMVLGLSLTVNKRWITLAPVATLIGLAVNLKDPDGLLKGKGEEGITCVLIPRETPHLEIGNRHLPADQPFMNGTIRAKDVFVSIDNIIGGQKKAGHGWQMLVDCLSIGRSISLPALATASSSVAYLTGGAFARVRKQFNVEIGEFEGIQEKLAEIAGLSYLINSTRLFTLAAVYQHKKPSVASAIVKYFNTELARTVVNDVMDVHAGRTVVVGPRNYLSSYYIGLPISITVEGSNIMSRNLLIFGQGSMACHPFIRKELHAISQKDESAFYKLFWQHTYYFLHHFAKAILSAWTGGIGISVPRSPLKNQLKKLSRLTYGFAWLADLSLIYLGGNLKRKERLSARLADALSYLYMALGLFHFYQQNTQSLQANERKIKADYQIHTEWAMKYCFYHAQQAMISFCENFPSRVLGKILRFCLFPLGQTMRCPSDKMDHQLAQLMMTNNAYRELIKKSVYLSGDSTQPIDRMEHAIQEIISHDDLYQKVKDLKRYKFVAFKNKLEEKVIKGEITVAEKDKLVELERIRWDAIQVDEFSFDSMKKSTFSSLAETFKNPLDD